MIVDTLKESTDPALTAFDISAPGKNQINTSSRSIIVGITSESPEIEGHDFDENREVYSVIATIQQVDYKKAKSILRSLKKAVISFLRKNLDDEYSEYMKHEGTDYGYDDQSFIRSIEIKLSFLVEDEYGEDLDEFNDIKVRGELDG